LGIWGDFWVIWAHAMRPYGFLGGVGRTRCAPTGFWGGLGARNAPLRVFGVIWAHAMRPYGFLGAPEGEKPPHQVNLDTFREKIFGSTEPVM